MPAIILLAALVFLVLALVLARFAPHPNAQRSLIARRGRGEARPAMPLPLLERLVRDLLEVMGMDEISARLGDRPGRLVAVRREPFRDVRHVVFIEAEPPGDLVEQTTVLELGEAVKGEGSNVGLLVTPFVIDTAGMAGLDVPIDYIDGARLRALVAEHLPGRLPELWRWRGFESRLPLPPTAGTELAPQPV